MNKLHLFYILFMLVIASSNSSAAIIYTETIDFPSSQVPGSYVFNLQGIDSFTVVGSLSSGDVDFFRISNFNFYLVNQSTFSISGYSPGNGGVGTFEYLDGTSWRALNFSSVGSSDIGNYTTYPDISFRLSSPSIATSGTSWNANYSVTVSTAPEPSSSVFCFLGAVFFILPRYRRY